MALNSSNSNTGSNTPGIGDRPLSAPHPQSPNTNNGTKTNVSGVNFNIADIFNPNLSGNLNIDKPSSNNSNTTEPKQDPWQAPPDLWRGPTLAQFGEETHYDYGTEPTMTVDEVYDLDKKNQPVVEKQGDYSASSNEKSNVKSSTFGKQDEISVTPTSVTENKGMIGNSAIQSVKGLDFQQKDKASVDVLDSKKKRDEVEAEDKADNMRNKLKGNVDKAAQEEGGEDFKIGTSEDEKAFNETLDERDAKLQEKNDLVLTRIAAIRDIDSVRYNLKFGGGAWLGDYDQNELEACLAKRKAELIDTAHKYGVDTSSLKTDNTSDDDIIRAIDDFFDDKEKTLDSEIENLNKKLAELGPASEPESTSEPQPGAQTSYDDAMNAIKNSENATPEQKAEAEEALTNLEESRKELEEAAAKARSGNPADMVAYQKSQEKYLNRLKEAQKIGNRWTQTDFNKKFTRAVAAANDFRVTLADGTEMEYSDFAAEEATKSPQYAKAMYEAKADQLKKDGHPVLAKLERWKAELSQTWLGSKLTQADNKVRDQFTQMAKTDMRATYAAYNNVLNDPNATEKQRSEASKAIEQAKALMTASAALQASTGFLSGIGDSPSDGISGTTDPEARNAWQKILNTVDNLTKITLGLGISPAANRAYQNMYYMAGDKVNNSLLFNKDFDGDGFALCQEYGNNAATGMIAGAGELAVGVALLFNPSSIASGIDLIIDAFNTALNGLYGVRNEAEKSQKYTQEVSEYFKEAENIAESSGNEEAIQEITNAITQIENFELKSDEVGSLDNWLEGSGSNTTSNEKFNQSLSYDEWLKLIEADPTMREFAKKLAEKKKKDENAKKDNADTGVNS